MEPVVETPELQPEQPAPPPPVRPRFRPFRWMMRLIVLFLFLQLGLWSFWGRNSLIQTTPSMILDDISNVAGDSDRRELRPRTYVISQRLADALGDDRLYSLEQSLSDFNGSISAADEPVVIDRPDACIDCLFVGIRQTLNTPFVAKTYTSYSRAQEFNRFHQFSAGTQQREHVYVYVLGRWVPLRARWLVNRV